MKINATCQHCGTQTQVHERFAGTSGPCRNCDQTMSVPAANAAASDMEQDPVPIPTRISSTPPLKGRFHADRDSPIPGCLLLIFMTMTVSYVAALLLLSEDPLLGPVLFSYWIALIFATLVLAVGTWLNKRGTKATQEQRRQAISDQLEKRNANGE